MPSYKRVSETDHLLFSLVLFGERCLGSILFFYAILKIKDLYFKNKTLMPCPHLRDSQLCT